MVWYCVEVTYFKVSSLASAQSYYWPVTATKPFTATFFKAMTPQITANSTFCSTACSRQKQTHQCSASLELCHGLHQGPVDYPYKGLVIREAFLCRDLNMPRQYQQINHKDTLKTDNITITNTTWNILCHLDHPWKSIFLTLRYNSRFADVSTTKQTGYFMPSVTADAYIIQIFRKMILSFWSVIFFKWYIIWRMK